MKRSIRGIVGHLLVIFGIFIPLIGFFGMSWNNLTAQRNYEAFKKTYANTADNPSFEEEIRAYNENIKRQNQVAVIDPFTANGYEGTYSIEAIGKNEVFSYLIIPKLDLVRPIYLDATNDHLSMGIAQIDGTSLPVGGESTRSVLAGHRGWYNDVMFLYLEDLEKGDIFYIDNGTTQLVYRVTTKEVIGPSDWDKLGPVEGKDMVTLLTCHPFRPPRPYRLLVNAERIIEETKEQTNANNVIQSLKIEKSSPTTQKFNLAIYTITAFLLIALIVEIFKFIKYLKK